ncbi:MAG: LCP family protein [Clostridiales Family XIII bacterium]|nr:LCP family protein [Clostridiales Family XIII bacterium]
MSMSDISETTKKKKGFNSKLFIKVFVLVFIIALVGGTAGVIYVNKLLDAPILNKGDGSSGSGSGGDEEIVRPTTPENISILVPGTGMFAAEFKDSKRVNVLVLGNTAEKLSDTIMLFSFDPEAKSVAIISVPRDTYYARAGYSSSYLKINSVFQNGPEASAEAVSDVLCGIPINYYAVASYDGVAHIVDSMGGVPFNVPKRMYYSAPLENLLIDLQAGEQILDGAHSVQYLRYRKGYYDGDLGRVAAQQEFMKAAIKQALNLNTLPALAKSIVENVDSDLTLRSILYVASEANGMNSDNVQAFMLPGVPEMIGGLSFYVAADDTKITAMLREIYDPPFTLPADATGPYVGVAIAKGAAEAEDL